MNQKNFFNLQKTKINFSCLRLISLLINECVLLTYSLAPIMNAKCVDPDWPYLASSFRLLWKSGFWSFWPTHFWMSIKSELAVFINCRFMQKKLFHAKSDWQKISSNFHTNYLYKKHILSLVYKIFVAILIKHEYLQCLSLPSSSDSSSIFIFIKICTCW